MANYRCLIPCTGKAPGGFDSWKGESGWEASEMVCPTKGGTPLAILAAVDRPTTPLSPLQVPGVARGSKGWLFGPNLRDGRHVLIVTSDNDFIPTQANRFGIVGAPPA